MSKQKKWRRVNKRNEERTFLEHFDELDDVAVLPHLALQRYFTPQRSDVLAAQPRERDLLHSEDRVVNASRTAVDRAERAAAQPLETLVRTRKCARGFRLALLATLRFRHRALAPSRADVARGVRVGAAAGGAVPRPGLRRGAVLATEHRRRGRRRRGDGGADAIPVGAAGSCAAPPCPRCTVARTVRGPVKGRPVCVPCLLQRVLAASAAGDVAGVHVGAFDAAPGARRHSRGPRRRPHSVVVAVAATARAPSPGNVGEHRGRERLEQRSGRVAIAAPVARTLLEDVLRPPRRSLDGIVKDVRGSESNCEHGSRKM